MPYVEIPKATLTRALIDFRNALRKLWRAIMLSLPKCLRPYATGGQLESIYIYIPAGHCNDIHK